MYPHLFIINKSSNNKYYSIYINNYINDNISIVYTYKCNYVSK